MSRHDDDITLRDVYREVQRVNERLRVVEIHLAAHRAEHKGIRASRKVLYPTLATAVGALGTALAPFVLK